MTKTTTSGTIIYHYDPQGRLIAETNGTGQTLVEYVYLDDEPLAMIRNESVFFYHTDHLGTPQVMTDSYGAVVWRALYSPFGNATIITSTVENNLRLPGQYYDAETGLHYNWNRYYDPKTGRYITLDPIGLMGGVNLYAYVGNNPVRWVDLLGLYWEYAQSTGLMTYVDNQTGARTAIGTGYSGQGAGVNNPAMQNQAHVGPIPQGTYDIGQAYRHQDLGRITMNLDPRPGTNTFGRDLFRIHGDNACQCRSASKGCIVLPRNVRERINSSKDRELRVVP